VTRALTEWDLEEVIELQNSLVEIYQTDEAFAEDLKAILEEKKTFESFFHMLKLSTSMSGVGEIPDMSRDHLEDMKRIQATLLTHESFPSSTLEGMYESALRKGAGSTAEPRVERPKKHLKELLGEWRQQATKPGGQEILLELGTQFQRLFEQYRQALNDGDFETAIQTFDKVIEIDKPEILSETPFLRVPEYKQMLVSCRDFINATSVIGDVVDEGRLTDGIAMAESLLQQYDDGNFPGLPADMARSAQSNLCDLHWQQKYHFWKDAFNADEYTQALEEIVALRGLESLEFFTDPIASNSGSFSARDFTDWNYLRTLHRHFHQTERPNLALKTVSYVLKRYESSEHAPTLPSLTPYNLEGERVFKWFYKALLLRRQCVQLIAEKEFSAALPLANAIGEEPKNAPERLREFVPNKLLLELDNEGKKIWEACMEIMMASQAGQT
jgi:tetratricopeptide (TPR) repeat protein